MNTSKKFWNVVVAVLLAVTTIFSQRLQPAYASRVEAPLYTAASQNTPFSQDWSNIDKLVKDNDWSLVNGIMGYAGAGLTTEEGVDPQLVVSQGLLDVNVIVNQTDPTAPHNGGVAEFHLNNPVVALAGSDTANAPSLVLYLNTTNKGPVQISYTVRDLDNSSRDSVQQVALQYRTGADPSTGTEAGDFINVPEAYIPDATEPNEMVSTRVNVKLPIATAHNPKLEIRIITTNAVGEDEWIGIDNISVTNYEEEEEDDPLPAVQSTYPVNNATNVPVSAIISITFTTEIATPSADWFTLKCANKTIPAIYGGSGSTYDVLPIDSSGQPTVLPSDSSCTFSIPEEKIFDTSGQPMMGSFTLNFKTEKVTYQNHAPVLVTPISDQTATEDTAYSFTIPANTFSDEDLSMGDLLTFTASLEDGSPLPTWLTFNAGTQTFSGTPLQAHVGTYNVRVTATDKAGLSASDVFTLTVQSQNDAPKVSRAIPDQVALEGEPFSFTFDAGTFTDEDLGDTLTYTASMGDDSPLTWLAFDPATRTFTGTPSAADIGEHTIKVTATDSTGLTASDSFIITVTYTNDAPVVNQTIGTQYANTLVPFTFTFAETVFTDEDVPYGDTLTYSAKLPGGANLPAWLTFNAATRTFSGTPAHTDAGTLVIILTATDTGGLTAATSFNLVVTETNETPLLKKPIADQTVYGGDAYQFEIPADTFTDGNPTDTLTYSVVLEGSSSLPDWLDFDNDTLMLTGSPTNAHLGAYDLRVTATDPHSASASDVFTLTVQNRNDAPELSILIPDQTANEDEAFSFTIPAGTFTDADLEYGDELTYTATRPDGSKLPTWLTFTPITRTFSGTPSNSDVGQVTVKVTVTDKAGLAVSDQFVITVNNVNDPPVVAHAIPNLTASSLNAFSYTIPANTFADIDPGDSLVISVALAGGDPLPKWLNFDATSRKLSGTPAHTDANTTLIIAVTATDKSGASVTDEFDLVVTETNEAPKLVPDRAIADYTLTVGEEFILTIPYNTFEDPNPTDNLTYSATLENGSPLPSWLKFNPTTRRFSATLTNEHVGVYNIRVTATDLRGLSASDVFTLTVLIHNESPTLANPIADQQATEDTAFSFELPDNTFADPDLADGDSLTLTATLADGGELPDWLNFNQSTGAFSGTPRNADVGKITIKVTATDRGGLMISDEFDLEVLNVNDAPVVASAIADQQADSLKPFSFTFAAGTFADEDDIFGDTLTYTAELKGGDPLPGWLKFNASTRTFSGTPAHTDAGTLTIVITATDKAGLTATDEFDLVVNETNEAPVLNFTFTKQKAFAGQGFELVLPENLFTDPNPNDTVTCTITLANGDKLPQWLTFDPNTHTLKGVPTSADLGTLTLKVTGTDSHGLTTTATFTLEVKGLVFLPMLVTP